MARILEAAQLVGVLEGWREALGVGPASSGLQCQEVHAWLAGVQQAQCGRRWSVGMMIGHYVLQVLECGNSQAAGSSELKTIPLGSTVQLQWLQSEFVLASVAWPGLMVEGH